MKILALLAVVLFQQSTFAFADWRTLTAPTLLPPGFQVQPVHDSDATGNGLIYIALVASTAGEDKLFFYSKPLYVRQPLGPVFPPFPIEIASAKRITSVQIRHNEVTGKTHFAYSKSDEFSLNGQTIYSESVIFATYHGPRTPSPITTETIHLANSSINHGANEVSLEIKGSQDAGIAFYTPGQNQTSSLSYAQRNGNESWTVEIVETGGSVGTACDLCFCPNFISYQPRIVYEDLASKRIKLATRLNSGTWTKSGIVTVFGQRSVREPALQITAAFGDNDFVVTNHITYILNDLPTRKVVLHRSSSQGNSTTEIDSVTNQPAQLEPQAFTAPAIIIAGQKIVISYNKHTGISSTPWLAVKNSLGPTFHKEAAPRIPTNNQDLVSATSLSLDRNFYPIITWSNYSGESVRASFCPDFTDDDQDGFLYREEMAFRMNPQIRDIHLAPMGEHLIVDDTNRPRFGLHFSLATQGTPNPDEQSITAGPFLYQYGPAFELRKGDETKIRPTLQFQRPPSYFVYFNDPNIKKDFLTVWVTRL